MKKILVLFAALWLMTFGLNAYALTDKAHEEDLGVRNSNGDYLGTISKIISDPLGNIDFVVLSLAKEKGGKEIVVPLQSLSKDEKERIVLNLSEKELATAPEFDMSSLEDPAYAARVYRFYGMMPPWSEGAAGSGEE